MNFIGRKNTKRDGPATLAGRALQNLRRGRAQQMLSATTAATAFPLAAEIFLNHYSGSFSNRWMWSPVFLSPALGVAGIAGVTSPRAARTWLPLFSVALTVNGLMGTWFHARGIYRKPGGFKEPVYNLSMGPPPLAPGSLTMIGGIGLAASVMRREKW